MNLTFSSEIEATDTSRRTISAKIAPYDTVGFTSVGKVIFERGSITWDTPKSVLFLEEHNDKARLGRAQSIEAGSDGWYGVFKLSASSRATDALIEASEGLKTGVSVGVEVIDSKPVNGVLHVLKATLNEVSLVGRPAFAAAQISEVAASEGETAEPTTTQPNESEAQVEIAPEAVAPEAVVETPAVEASRPVVTAAVGYTRPRVAPISSSQYLGASIKAAMGDDAARQTILAADDSVSTNTGLTLPTHLTEFMTTTFSGRPAFDAVTRAGAVPQLSFTVPKMGTAPTTAVTAEGAAPSETGMTSSYDTVTAAKYSSLNRVSFELLDFSNPAFETLLMNEMRKGYEKATDAALIAAFTTSGVQAATTAATAAGLQSFIATESAAALRRPSCAARCCATAPRAARLRARALARRALRPAPRAWWTRRRPSRSAPRRARSPRPSHCSCPATRRPACRAQ
jgi:HK97 family phage prohead protease